MSDKKNEEDILWEIGRRKGAGIIPFSISDKHENVYWLLGKERDMPGWAQGSCRWSDFGGSSHYMDEDEAHTAAREYFEETLGVVPLGIPEDFVADEKKQDHHHHHRNDEAIRRLASYLRQGNCLCKIHMSVRMSPDAKQSKELTAAARYEMFLNGLSEHDNNNNIKTAADWKHNVAYVVRIPWQPDLPERFNNMRNQLMRFNQQETDIFRMDRQIPHLYPFLRPGMHMPISFVPEEDEMLPERVKFVKNVSFANDCPPQTNNNGEGYPEEQHMVRNRNLECERDNNRKLIVEYQPCCSVCADHDFEPHRQTCDCEKDTKIHIIDLNTMEMRDWAYQYKKIFHDRAYLFKVYNDLPVHVKDHRSFVKTIMFGKMVHIRVDKVHLEKQKIQWWSSDRLQEMMQNGGHFKGQYARICFLPSMSVAVEAVKELRGENICPSYHPAYVTSIPPAYYYNRNRNNNYSGGKRYTNNNNNNNNRPRFTNSNNQIYSHHHKRYTTAIEGIISKTDETDDDDDDDNPKKGRRYSADI